LLKGNQQTLFTCFVISTGTNTVTYWLRGQNKFIIDILGLIPSWVTSKTYYYWFSFCFESVRFL